MRCAPAVVDALAGPSHLAPCGKQYFTFNKLDVDVGVGIVGPNNGQDPEGEADQDIQWIMGVGQRVDTVFWSTASENGFILDWLEEVASTPDDTVPRVFSVSYGNPEELTNKQFGAGYIQVCPRACGVIVSALVWARG